MKDLIQARLVGGKGSGPSADVHLADCLESIDGIGGAWAKNFGSPAFQRQKFKIGYEFYTLGWHGIHYIGTCASLMAQRAELAFIHWPPRGDHSQFGDGAKIGWASAKLSGVHSQGCTIWDQNW